MCSIHIRYKKIAIPKILPIQHKGDFLNLKDFNEHKDGLPEWANYDSKLSAKSHICYTSKHKMRIQYGKCTNEDCLCTGRCERSFKHIYV